jgi:hypothetical protein
MEATKILYNFKPYLNKRVGLFSLEKDNGAYSLSSGWEKILKEEAIIGETKDTFVTELKPYTEGRWIGKKVVYKNYILPLGIHKTRLKKWCTGQLELF